MPALATMLNTAVHQGGLKWGNQLRKHFAQKNEKPGDRLII